MNQGSSVLTSDLELTTGMAVWHYEPND